MADPFSYASSLYNSAYSKYEETKNTIISTGQNVLDTVSSTSTQTQNTLEDAVSSLEDYSTDVLEIGKDAGTAVASTVAKKGAELSQKVDDGIKHAHSLASTAVSSGREISSEVSLEIKEGVDINLERAETMAPVVKEAVNEVVSGVTTYTTNVIGAFAGNVKDEVEKKSREFAGKELIKEAPRIIDEAKPYVKAAVDASEPYVKTTVEAAKPYVDDAISYASSSRLGRQVLERAARDTFSIAPVVGGALSLEGACEDLSDAYQSYNKSQYISATLYTGSAAMNGIEVAAAGAELLEIAGGTATAETGVGALAGAGALAVTVAGDSAFNVISFGIGTSADIANNYGY